MMDFPNKKGGLVGEAHPREVLFQEFGTWSFGDWVIQNRWYVRSTNGNPGCFLVFCLEGVEI